ncbi:BZ3500_MvSof-1268-A1-R1_Chr1-3g01581 [Microbotryum saponariae]|uniref:BZ3500_MvSof-1268-A1-R1_Chr1-3g01581 protein n=1 Tax=Microbotryum saponariae TaxID=289078 RepID=A0A2X0L2K0_9BASI|nr:BZ3500_MvSof-1268-A1-R1_Chr1-3g01581 [Microbotryum saponariae]SCZ94089.1 BZ3501_MvSof-1269-A2-R1_Chr1-3g01183 [Microbotryum saponariae]
MSYHVDGSHLPSHGDSEAPRPRPRSLMAINQSSSYTDTASASSSPSASRKAAHRSAASISSLSSLSLTQNDYPRPGTLSPTPMSHSYSQAFASTLGDRDDHTANQATTIAIRGPEGAIMDHAKMQNKVFCNWCVQRGVNSRLEPRGFEPVVNLSQDFHDGTKLIELVEALTEQSLGRYNQMPTHRVQKFENAKLALDRIKEMGVHLTNIGAEDIVDGNLKLILGMIWSMVLRFSIADISEEGSHAKEGLLLWCQRKTQGYEGVDVQNFTRSFQDGLAFCALIHRHRPDLIDWDSLPKDPRRAADNLRKAFKIAEERLGIKQWLDVEDVCNRKPDDKSIMTYVAQFFHAFSTTAQTETEARVIGNFVDNMSSLMSAVHDYERRVGQLLDSFTIAEQGWSQPLPPQISFVQLKAEQTAVEEFRRTELRAWVTERVDLATLLINIQTKLKTYGLRVYQPTEEYSSEYIATCLNSARNAELARKQLICGEIRRLQDEALAHVVELAEALSRKISTLHSRLSGLAGTLDSQLECTRMVLSSLPSLTHGLDALHAAEENLIACEVSPLVPRGTVHSHESLDFELELVASSAKGRIAFIDNQIIARKASSVSPEEMEEFESVFRAFDKDGDNHLALEELEGALGALGISEINLAEMHDSNQGELVSFSEFITFLVQRSEDRLTAEKVRSCFHSAAANKVRSLVFQERSHLMKTRTMLHLSIPQGYVTELDLTRLDLPTTSVEFLKEWMPQVEVDGTEGQSEEGACYDYETFLETFVD